MNRIAYFKRVKNTLFKIILRSKHKININIIDKRHNITLNEAILTINRVERILKNKEIKGKVTVIVENEKTKIYYGKEVLVWKYYTNKEDTITLY